MSTTAVEVVQRTPWQKERARIERLRIMVHRAVHHGEELDLPLVEGILEDMASRADLEILVDADMLVEEHDLEDDYFEDQLQEVG